MMRFTKYLAVMLTNVSLAASLSLPVAAESLGVGASIGGSQGIGAGLGASVGGTGGANVGGGAKIGGSQGVSAGLGASVGGRNGIDAGATASVGGSRGVTAGGGATVGGGNGVDGGLNASVGGRDGIGLGLGLSIGGNGSSTPGTVKPVTVPPGKTAQSPKPGILSTIFGGTTRTSTRTADISGFSSRDIVRLKRRCVDIVSGGYDSDLVSLCRAIMSR